MEPNMGIKLEKCQSIFTIATEVHTANDLYRKQRSGETLQQYIQNFTDVTEKAMGVDPDNIMNRVIIFLFIKNLYNIDIKR